MLAPAQILETKQLLETSAGALVAGVGIPAAISITILGYIRAPELWRDGDRLRGSLYGFACVLAGALAASILVIGLRIVVGGPA